MDTLKFVNKHHDLLIKWILKDCKCYAIEDDKQKEITNDE